MSDPLPQLDPDDGSTTGAPRWVKVSLIIAGVVVALLLILLLVLVLVRGPGGAGHGPGQHAPPATGTEQGVQQR